MREREGFINSDIAFAKIDCSQQDPFGLGRYQSQIFSYIWQYPSIFTYNLNSDVFAYKARQNLSAYLYLHGGPYMFLLIWFLYLKSCGGISHFCVDFVYSFEQMFFSVCLKALPASGVLELLISLRIILNTEFCTLSKSAESSAVNL